MNNLLLNALDSVQSASTITSPDSSSVLGYFTSTPQSTLVNLIILLLFLGLLIKVIYEFYKYQLEKKQFTILDRGINKFEVTKEWSFLKNIDFNSTVGKRVQALNSMKMRGVHITESLLNEVNEKYPFASLSGSKKLMQSLVLLGLFGTILGLSISLTGLNQLSGSVGETADIISKLEKIIEGLDTAFSTTLAGLVATFLLLLLTVLYEKAAANLEQRLEALLLSNFLSNQDDKSGEPKLQELLNTVQRQYEGMNILSQHLISASSVSANQYQMLFDAASSFKSSIETFIEPFKEQVNIQREIIGAVKEHKEIAKELREMSVLLKESYTELIEKSVAISNAISHNTVAVELVATKMQAQMEKSDEISKKMDQNATQILELHNKLVKVLEDIRFEVVNMLASFKGELASLIGDLKRSIIEVLDGIAQMLKDQQNTIHNTLMEVIATLVRSIHDLIRQIEDAMRNSGMDQVSDALRQIISQLDDGFRSIQQTLRQISEKSNDIDNNQSNYHTGYIAQFMTLNELIKDILPQLTAIGKTSDVLCEKIDSDYTRKEVSEQIVRALSTHPRVSALPIQNQKESQTVITFPIPPTKVDVEQNNSDETEPHTLVSQRQKLLKKIIAFIFKTKNKPQS